MVGGLDFIEISRVPLGTRRISYEHNIRKANFKVRT